MDKHPVPKVVIPPCEFRYSIAFTSDPVLYTFLSGKSVSDRRALIEHLLHQYIQDTNDSALLHEVQMKAISAALKLSAEQGPRQRKTPRSGTSMQLFTDSNGKSQPSSEDANRLMPSLPGTVGQLPEVATTGREQPQISGQLLVEAQSEIKITSAIQNLNPPDTAGDQDEPQPVGLDRWISGATFEPRK